MTLILGRAVVAETTRWDPTGTTTLNFSFNNLHVVLQAGTNIYRAVRSTTAKSTGRWYFELTIQNHPNLTGFVSWVGGIGLGTTDLLTQLGGDTDGSIGFSANASPPDTTSAWTHGSSAVTYFTFNWSLNDQFGYAVDLTNHTVWARNVSRGLDWTRFSPPYGLWPEYITADPSTGYPVPPGVPIYIMWSGYKAATATISSALIVTAPGSLARGSPPENFFWWDHGLHHS